jgi:hypothetical protein
VCSWHHVSRAAQWLFYCLPLTSIIIVYVHVRTHSHQNSHQLTPTCTHTLTPKLTSTHPYLYARAHTKTHINSPLPIRTHTKTHINSPLSYTSRPWLYPPQARTRSPTPASPPVPSTRHAPASVPLLWTYLIFSRLCIDFILWFMKRLLLVWGNMVSFRKLMHNQIYTPVRWFSIVTLYNHVKSSCQLVEVSDWHKPPRKPYSNCINLRKQHHILLLL